MKTRILVSEQGIADTQTGTGDKPKVLRRSVIGELSTVQSRKLTVRDKETRYKIDKQSEYGKKSRKSDRVRLFPHSRCGKLPVQCGRHLKDHDLRNAENDAS